LSANRTKCDLSKRRLTTSLRAGDFNGLSELRILSLEGNGIPSLPEDIFDGLSELVDLRLDNNKLNSLPEDIFDGLSRLDILEMNSNDLSTLPEDIFDGLSSLKWLDLYNNELTSLPEEIFDGLSRLNTLIVAWGNDLTCLPNSVPVTLPKGWWSFKPPQCSSIKTRASFLSGSVTVGEDTGAHGVTVNLNPAPVADVTLSYTVGGTAIAGADYTALSGSVAVKAGENSVTIPVAITDDKSQEENETIILTLTGGVGYDLGTKTTHTLTIADNNAPPMASFASSSQSIDEDTGTHHVTVNLDRALSTPTNFTYTLSGTATEDTDYTTVLLSGFMRLGTWTTSFTIPLAITHDLIDEQDETVILTLTDGAGYSLGATKIHTLTIKDVPKEEITKPIVSFASSELTVDEAVGRHAVTLSVTPVTNPKPTDLENLPAEPGIPVFYTVGGTAKEGQDYTGLRSDRIAKMQAPMG